MVLFDIESMDDSFLFPGDGGAHTKVEFRFVVFRPFIEEVIVGKIKNCTKEGVHGMLSFDAVLYLFTVKQQLITNIEIILLSYFRFF